MNTAMRVMLLTPQPFLEWRGSPLRVNCTVHALAELGLHVDLLAFPFGLEPELPAHTTLYRPPNLFRRSGISIGPSAWKLAYDVLLARLAYRIALTGSYSVFHGIEEAGWLAVRLAMRYGTRAIYEKHSDPASHRGRWFKNLVLRSYARLEAHMARKADLVIATGPGLAMQIQRLAPSAQVHTIFDVPSACAEPLPERVATLRRLFCPEPENRLVAYAGSFAVYQGLDLLFSAFPIIMRLFPNARGLIIGGDPEEIRARRAQLATDGLADRVHFAGCVPPNDLPNYLAAADVLLSPRLTGVNTPLKILDYLKAGRPIVAVDSEANRWLLDPDWSALTAPEPEAFATAAAELLGDDTRRAVWARKGRNLFEAQYSYPAFRGRLAKAYESLGIALSTENRSA